MAELGDKLIGCRIQVKDRKSSQLISDTRITAYDTVQKIVKISASGLKYFGQQEVSVLIFCPNRLLEYYGILERPVIANEFQIRLHSGRNKEDRKKQRYEMRAKGKVEGIVIEKQMITLRKPIEFVTHNISANGVLLEAMAGSFEKGNRIRILLDLGETTIQGVYEVVRVQNQNLWTTEYGCRYIVARKSGKNYGRREESRQIKKNSN